MIQSLLFALAFSAANQAHPPAAPSSATARCRDGTYSFSAHRRGTCSHHGGVSAWLSAAPRPPDSSLAMCSWCGFERWTVKTLSDSSARTVDLSDTVNTTIEELVALPRPTSLPRHSRANAVERTLYRVEARLLWLQPEGDNDYHLVLASPRDTTITMIAEVPEPSCAGACVSGFAPVYARVRQTLVARGLAAKLETPARPNHGRRLFRLPARSTRRCPERDRATSRAQRCVSRVVEPTGQGTRLPLTAGCPASSPSGLAQWPSRASAHGYKREGVLAADELLSH